MYNLQTQESNLQKQGYSRALCLDEWMGLRQTVLQPQDWEAVVEFLMQRGEAERALPVLRRPGVSQELWYKFAPTLMLLAPGPTVDAWMAAQPPLDPPRYDSLLDACNSLFPVLSCNVHHSLTKLQTTSVLLHPRTIFHSF